MARVFIVDDRKFDDPDPKLSVEEVKKSLTDFFPELSNAETLPVVKKGEDEVYEFRRRVGTKGEEDYPWIRKWGAVVGSRPPGSRYLKEELERAREDGAPATAVYKKSDGVWVTTDDVTDPRTRHGLGLPALERTTPEAED